MVDEVRSVETTDVRDRRRPGRVEYDDQHLIDMLRHSVAGGGATRATNIDGWLEESDDVVDQPAWSDRTILSVTTGLTVLAIVMWTTIAWALWRTFFG